MSEWICRKGRGKEVQNFTMNMRPVRVRVLFVLVFVLAASLFYFTLNVKNQSHEETIDDQAEYWIKFGKFPVEYKSTEDEMEYWRHHGKENGKLPNEMELKMLWAKDVHLYFHSFLDNVATLCHRTMRLGSITMNGACRICDDEEYRPRVPCIVYSFGIGTDYVVEDDFARLYGCHVCYFDPSLEVDQQNRSERVSLHKMGLGGKQGYLEPSLARVRNSMGWSSSSLSQIKAKLGHKQVTLDVVKLDLDGWEWTALADMAASGELDRVRQLIVEFHNYGGSDAEVTRPRLALLRTLEKAGFKIFSTNLDEWAERQHNVYPVVRTSSYEISFVNTRLARPNAKPVLDSTKKEAQENGHPLPGVVNMEYLRANGKERGGLPDEEQLKALSDKQVHYTYHSYLDNIHYHCNRTIKLGNLVDGGYKVCDDQQYRPQKPCIVYSFGIRNDFSFDDAIASAYGCEVYSFDPSMTAKSHRRSSHVAFYKIGLGGKGGELEQKGDELRVWNHWQVMSLRDIKAMLGHKDMVLDVVKIDIEDSEWITLADMAATGELSKVRQLLMEFHIFGGSDADVIRRRLAVVKLLEQAGFRSFNTWQFAWEGIIRLEDTYPVVRTICYETSFVNINLARSGTAQANTNIHD